MGNTLDYAERRTLADSKVTLLLKYDEMFSTFFLSRSVWECCTLWFSVALWFSVSTLVPTIRCGPCRSHSDFVGPAQRSTDAVQSPYRSLPKIWQSTTQKNILSLADADLQWDFRAAMGGFSLNESISWCCQKSALLAEIRDKDIPVISYHWSSRMLFSSKLWNWSTLAVATVVWSLADFFVRFLTHWELVWLDSLARDLTPGDSFETYFTVLTLQKFSTLTEAWRIATIVHFVAERRSWGVIMLAEERKSFRASSLHK